MKTAFWKCTDRNLLLIAPLVMQILTGSVHANDWFVDQDKSSGMSGFGQPNWSDAFITLEEALEQASSGDTIFVAEGTYTPNDDTGTGAQAQTYLIDRTLIILGGYKGEDETESMQRDPKVFLTILSGDFQNPTDTAFIFDRDYLTDDSRTDNAFTVVTVQNVTQGTRIEGFIIQSGNRGTPAGTPGSGVRGGGMYIDDSEMDVVNCTFRFNAVGIPPDPEIPFDLGTTSDGGGATVRGGQAVMGEVRYTRFINCTFHDNFAGRGGALALVDESLEDPNVKVINCRFYDNRVIELSTAVLKPGDDNDRLVHLPMERQSP